MTSAIKRLLRRLLPPVVIERLRPHTSQIASPGERNKPRRTHPEATESVAHLEEKLWAGYVEAAREGLERLAHTSEPTGVPAEAALALARFDIARCDWDKALGWLTRAEVARAGLDPEILSLIADCLAALGDSRKALARLAPLVDRRRPDASTVIRLGSLRSSTEPAKDHGSGPMVEAINRLYVGHGFAEVRRRSTDLPPGTDNLVARAPRAEPAERHPLVSVVIPWDGDRGQAGTAVESITNQSWNRIEVIVVHPPASPPREQYRFDDPRIRLVAHETWNHASAWNAGAAEAHGALVMAHRSDEWSHPQRVEVLATSLLARRAPASGSFHLTVGTDFQHRYPTGRPGQNLFSRSHSSLLLTSEALTRLGLWDASGPWAAEEFAHRVEAHFGSGSIAWADSGLPLSIIVDSSEPPYRTSTATDAAERYRQAFRWWHTTEQFDDGLPFRPGVTPHPFANTFAPEETETVLGTLVVGDLGGNDPTVDACLDFAARSGRQLGVVHIPSFKRPTRPMASDIRQRVAALGGAILTGDSVAACDLLLLTASVVESPPFDHLPTVRASRATVPSGVAVDRDRMRWIETWSQAPVTIAGEASAQGRVG